MENCSTSLFSYRKNKKQQVSFFKENTIQVCTLLHACPYRNDLHQAQLIRESLIVTNMTLSFKWKEKHFSQRHHTFVDKKCQLKKKQSTVGRENIGDMC